MSEKPLTFRSIVETRKITRPLSDEEHAYVIKIRKQEYGKYYRSKTRQPSYSQNKPPRVLEAAELEMLENIKVKLGPGVFEDLFRWLQ